MDEKNLELDKANKKILCMEEENIRLREARNILTKELDEYQKSLDNIDLWAMEIQNLIKKIRSKI